MIAVYYYEPVAGDKVRQTVNIVNFDSIAEYDAHCAAAALILDNRFGIPRVVLGNNPKITLRNAQIADRYIPPFYEHDDKIYETKFFKSIFP